MSSRRFLVVTALVAGALVGQTGLASPARAAGPRYAAPTGTSAQDCLTPATACSLDKAINQATANDDVIVAPGTYNMGATGLASSQPGVKVHGTAGQARPVINSAADTGLALSGACATVSDLTINHSGAF